MLLSEHHDCWIVPYNISRRSDTSKPTLLGLPVPGTSWAEKVANWTEQTRQASDAAAQESIAALAGDAPVAAGADHGFVRLFNTVVGERQETARVALPDGWAAGQVRVLDDTGREVPSQVAARPGSDAADVLFTADVPSIGYSTYRLEKMRAAPSAAAGVTVQADGSWKIDTDLYALVLDPSRGGVIQSLKAKRLNQAEYVDAGNARRFAEIRGYFFEQQKYLSSADHPAALTLLENGPVQVRVQICGSIGSHPLTQTLTLCQGQPAIDFHLRIDWQGSPGIGSDYSQAAAWKKEDYRKAFYDDREKLQVLFPLKLESRKIYKNAPFDVTESKLADTFFTTWDGIKNNIILNWVDAIDGTGNRGTALFSDHTTSYVHGADSPLGLTLQYAGIGLWGRKYSITGPTEVHFALAPHAGTWAQAGIWTQSDRWNEPLVASSVLANPPPGPARQSMVDIAGPGWEISAIVRDQSDLLVRVFNAEGDATPHQMTFGGQADRVETAELDGREIGELPTQELGGKLTATLSIPRFRIQTLRLVNWRQGPASAQHSPQ